MKTLREALSEGYDKGVAEMEAKHAQEMAEMEAKHAQERAETAANEAIYIEILASFVLNSIKSEGKSFEEAIQPFASKLKTQQVLRLKKYIETV